MPATNSCWPAGIIKRLKRKGMTTYFRGSAAIKIIAKIISAKTSGCRTEEPAPPPYEKCSSPSFTGEPQNSQEVLCFCFCCCCCIEDEVWFFCSSEYASSGDLTEPR